MNPQEYNTLHIFHILSALVLMGWMFYGFAAPPATRKKVMIWTGVASLLILLTGVRMWQALPPFSVSGWIVIKLLCWLGLSALAGLAYRKREQAGALAWVAIVLAATAVAMAYVKPF